ncbi:MAG: SDR family NAD(P)-dependent oxidoreductase [Hyphomicrobiaceae bacterium]|nr:SDR family NAD(P)-dependent oxidoreductase [Hyphomicrobiaceae bacterium]
MTPVGLFERWLARRARPDAAAIAATSGLNPAVVVIGGSAGIGLAIAQRFASAGHVVAIVGRDPDKLAAAVATLAAAPGRPIHSIALDVTDLSATRALDEALGAASLYADIVVLSAGTGLSGPFLAEEPETIDALLRLNVAATSRLLRHYSAQLVARGRGGIITIASLGGFVPGPYQAAYYASKAFQVSLSLALAEELSGQGVRVAVVAPGPVDTSFHAAMEADGALYRRLLPSMSPEAVAASVYRGYRFGNRLIVPGLLNWAVARMSGLIPHRLMVMLVAKLLWPG